MHQLETEGVGMVKCETLTEQFGLAKTPTVPPTDAMQLSLNDLEKAVSLRRKIEGLEKQLAAIFEHSTGKPSRRTAKRRMSTAARARISAAAKARWAKWRGNGK